ncbi:MAG: Y-family DNA polymerase [Ginsengibacter sp.]
MYALVDCNNFYVSCERLFNPKLERKPVIVLSNNDGCAISRSDEAKALGIEMGTPPFLMRDIIEKGQVAIFSSNYTLYGDISDRVMKTLESFVPRLEIYSIDEAFLDMHDLDYIDLLELGLKIRTAVMQNIGIPVCVGIAPTKTLAKMANRYAKKYRKGIGVHWAANDQLTREMLSATEVGDIWGIGRQYALFLKRNGFNTAFDFLSAPEEWIRKNMTVVVQRLFNELKGVPAISWEFIPPAKKNICTSRSFGKLQTNKEEIKEALCNYAAACALKLRNQNCCCRSINVFLQTNLHRTQDKQYSRSLTIDLQTPTNFTGEIIKYVVKAFEIIFKDSYNYLKCGVIALDIVRDDQVQSSLFDQCDRKKNKTIMQTMDKVNKSLGKETVRLSVQGFEKRYRLKTEHLSSHFTTDLKQVLKVKI